jgi:hypothetical protein
MKLMDCYASATEGLGATHQRFLSSIAHSQLHGLTQFMMNAVSLGAENGMIMHSLNTTARSLAQRLIIGPMCAATLVGHLGWFAGWDIDDQRSLMVRMFHAWGRIAGVPYPGPGA